MIVDDEVAILTEEKEHTKGGVLQTLLVLTRDGVCDALEHAHRRGRAHGYLWPDRVWMGPGEVRLLDVCLERALATSMEHDDLSDVMRNGPTVVAASASQAMRVDRASSRVIATAARDARRAASHRDGA